ncbi:hypothetical protein WN55_07134 [Dufourea novaeangliae]|uniref:Uncharacterized protein n=1 Tax=Dufourea novaeangliae TaxID=178035 RepID=A0A154P4A1_DUFNO|nr:hypothetical protein WN55_07134 [Dufourea novaeangliae]
MYNLLFGVFVVCALSFAFSPFITRNKVTPLNTAYLFLPREKYWGLRVTFALNIFHLMFTTPVILLDLLIITIIWHASCKFVEVGEALRTIKAKKLRGWIREHQAAISYADDVNHLMAPLAIKSTIAVTLSVIISGLVIAHGLPLFEMSKFFMLTAFSMLRFLMCSYAADVMIVEAQDIAWRVYDSPWLNATPGVRKEAVIIIQRCQKPIAIHSAGFLTAWSLRFCGQGDTTRVNVSETKRPENLANNFYYSSPDGLNV